MAVTQQESVSVERDVPYSGDLLCDIYRPSQSQTRQTAVLHFHGGGFRAGSKVGARLAMPLAERGYTCISATYRLLPALWPAQLEDVKAAIRWVRSRAADLGVVPERLALVGYSAGAHLALIASADAETHVGACIAFYPPAELRSSHPLVMGLDESVQRSADPLSHVRAGFPPTMLLHGTEDRSIPVDASLRLYAALQEADVPAELHVVEGVTHIFDSHPDLAAASAVWIDLFLDRHVVNPRTYPSTEPGPR